MNQADGMEKQECDRPAQPVTSRTYSFGWFDWFCLWYPPGWLILFNRHWQQYHTDPEGWNWVEYGLFLLPAGFYIAWFLRWLRLGCRTPHQTATTLDPHYQEAFRQEVLMPILTHYFRAELHQTEQLPDQGPVIVLMNHAGMCFPWDLIMLGVLLGNTREWITRPLAHEIFFDHPWLHWWLPVGWAQVLGSVRATHTHFEAALQSQESNVAVLYAPEGWQGLAKGWQHRYQLQTFDPSFIKLSDRHHIPLLPVVCIGNEALHPWTVNLKWVAQRLGLPIFPLSLHILLFLLFPSMGVWANRARLRYFIQPLHLPWDAPDLKPGQLQQRSVAYARAQALRSYLQSAINTLRQGKNRSV